MSLWEENNEVRYWRRIWSASVKIKSFFVFRDLLVRSRINMNWFIPRNAVPGGQRDPEQLVSFQRSPIACIELADVVLAVTSTCEKRSCYHHVKSVCDLYKNCIRVLEEPWRNAWEPVRTEQGSHRLLSASGWQMHYGWVSIIPSVCQPLNIATKKEDWVLL